MFTLSKDQTAKLRANLLGSFEHEMALYCRAFAPERCEVLENAQLLTAVRRVLDRARAHRFHRRGPVRLFLELTLLLGHDFDTDPQYPWANDILRERYSPDMTRARRLYEKSLNYAMMVFGSKRQLARAALRKLAVGVPLSSSLSPDVLTQQIWSIYPEKAEYVGQEALASLVREALSVTTKHNVVHATSDVCWLMLVFGYGFVNDPFIPAFKVAFEGYNVGGSEERARALRREARIQVERTLAHLDASEGK